MAARAEIKGVFSSITKTDFKNDDLLEHLYEMGVTFGIAPKDLGNKWESFTLNRQLPIVPTLSSLNTFKQELNEKWKPSAVVKKEKDRPALDKASLPKAPFAGLDIGDMLGEYDTGAQSMQLFQESLKKRQEQAEEDERKRKIAAAEASRVQRFKHEDPVSGSPMKSAQVSASAPSSSQSAGGAGKFEARTNKGKVSQTHNEALPKALASPTQITVEELSVVRYKRCMNNTFDAMSGYLEGRLKRLGEAALADNKLVLEGLLERPSQDPIVSFGRICSELDEIVTPSSLIIEGLAHGIKPRMPLDFSEMESYSVFPGQVTALKGVNTGKRFVVSQLMPPHPLPHRAPPADGLSLLVAAGPYTHATARSYEMLSELLEVVRTTRPSAVVLLGPFVDADHAGVAKPHALTVTYDDLFNSDVVDRLAEVATATKTHFFLVPSVKDAHHVFPYPQPPFELASTSDYIHMLSNPATFSLNGVVIGVSSLNLFTHMKSREVNPKAAAASASQPSADRMSRIFDHVLQQRSYYPLYPAVLPDNGNGLGYLDVSLMQGAELPDCSPHVLIVPSPENVGFRTVSNTLCINPGPLGQFEIGGYYASVVVHPKDGVSGGSASNGLVERIRADVVHI